MSTAVRYQWGLFLAAGLVLLTNLGGPLLWDEDETIYAQIVSEMWARGDWIVPTFNETLSTDKPPLLYWVMLVARAVLGPTEFAARIGSALAALVTVWLVYDLGRRLYSATAGLWSALALVTALIYDVSARAATTDSLLVLFAVAGFWIYVRAGGVTLGVPRWPVLALIYATMGLGNLTKGPVGFVCPVAALVWFEMARPGRWPAVRQAADGSRFVHWARELAAFCSPVRVWRAGWSLRPVLAVAVLAAVSLPWFVLVGLETDGAWLVGFFGDHNYRRAISPNYNHSGSLLYYVLGALAGMFPWSVFLPLAVVDLGLRIRRAEASAAADRWLVCWVLAYLVPFSLVSTKLPNYVLPAYPALALMIGALVARWQREPTLYAAVWGRMAYSAAALGGLGIVVGLGATGYWLLDGRWDIGLVGLVMTAGGVAAQLLYVAGRHTAALRTFAVASVGFATLAFGYTAEQVSPYHSAARLTLDWRAVLGTELHWAGFRHQTPSEVYYGRQTMPYFSEPAEAAAYFAESPDGYLLTWSHQYDDLAAALPADVRVLDRRRRFLRPGELLLIGRPGGAADRLARQANDSTSLAR